LISPSEAPRSIPRTGVIVELRCHVVQGYGGLGLPCPHDCRGPAAPDRRAHVRSRRHVRQRPPGRFAGEGLARRVRAASRRPSHPRAPRERGHRRDVFRPRPHDRYVPLIGRLDRRAGSRARNARLVPRGLLDPQGEGAAGRPGPVDRGNHEGDRRPADGAPGAVLGAGPPRRSSSSRRPASGTTAP